MTTSYTSLLGFALPVEGELDGTWGDTVNNQITQLVEDSVAGAATQSVTSGNWTLTTTGSGSQNQARCAILIPTGSPGVSRNIVAPSQSKAYVVVNQSDASVVLKGSATTGVTILSGQSVLCAWNGSDFAEVASGNVDGPASATDNAFARFDGTTGKVIQNSTGATLDDTGAASFTGSVNVAGTSSSAADLKLYEDTDNGTNYIGLKAPATVAANLTFIIPGTDGSANYILKTDGSGNLSFTNTLVNPTVTNYVETLYNIGTLTTSHTIDLTNGTVQQATLTASTACTFTMPTATAGKSFTLFLKQPASIGNATATFTGVKFNAVYTMTSTAGYLDILSFISDGTSWYGNAAQSFDY